MRFWVEIAVAFLLTALIAGVARAADVEVVQSVLVCPQLHRVPSADRVTTGVREHPHGYRYFGTPLPGLVRHLQQHYASMNRTPSPTVVRGCHVRYHVIQKR